MISDDDINIIFKGAKDETMFSIFKAYMLRLASMGGGLQAVNINASIYTYYGVVSCNSGVCTIQDDGTGKFNYPYDSDPFFTVTESMSGTYSSITVMGDFTAETSNAGIFGFYGDVGELVNNGYLHTTVENGVGHHAITVGQSSGSTATVDTIINYGTIIANSTSNNNYYAIYVNSTGYVGEVINENGATMGDIRINSGGGIGSIANEYNATMGSITNYGDTKTMDLISNAGTMGSITSTGTINKIFNTGTMSGITNYATINTIENNGGNITGEIRNGTGSTINELNNHSGIINAITNNSGSKMEYITNGGTITTLTNSGTMGDINNTGTIIGITNYASSTINTIYNSDTGEITGITNYATIDTIENYGNITGEIRNGSGSTINTLINRSGGTIDTITNNTTIGDIYNYSEDDEEGLINTITNNSEMGNIYNTGTINAIANNSDGSMKDIHNEGTINTLTNNSTDIGIITNYNTGTMGTLNNTGTMGNINNYGIIDIITNDTYGTIDSITNYKTIGAIDSSGAISAINNYGIIEAIKYTNSDTQLILEDYEDGLILLNENVKAYDKYVQIYSNNISITSYTLTIAENAEDFNSFSGYTNVDDLKEDDIQSHLTIGVDTSSSGNINIGTIVINLDYDKIDTNTNYSLASLVALYNVDDGEAIDYSYYSSYGLNLDDSIESSSIEYGRIYTNNELEYTLIASDDYGFFQIYEYTEGESQEIANTNFKNSPAHLFYQNTISQLDNIVHQTELTMYSNAKCHNTDTQYSESDDDCFFFTPFITHNNIYNSGDGLSYGFVSGYNKQLEHSLFGVHIGFSYGNVESDYLSNHLDMNTMLLLLGLHYRYMFDNNLYIKLRGDFFYAMHDVKGNYITSDPDSLGLNIGASMGAQIHINKESPLYGVVDIETGIRYTGLNNSAFVFDANYNGVTYQESHKSSFTNLAYFDINAKYDKYLGDSNQWTINTVIGAQMLIPSLPTIETTAIATKSHTTKSYIDINDIEGYVLFGIDYKVSNNVSLMLNYLGIYGNNSMSNSGFFNIRVWW